MGRLTTGIRYEKCVVRRFRRCAKVIECTYTNLDIIACYTSRLYGIAQASATYGTRAKRGTRNDFQWYAE
jgi:hypothetical protein